MHGEIASGILHPGLPTPSQLHSRPTIKRVVLTNNWGVVLHGALTGAEQVSLYHEIYALAGSTDVELLRSTGGERKS